ncbi:NAD(P)/FAD-dependent oxidoreductase [Blastochloris viridis]|uniref:Ferredoxin reductase n=1 Tax=Blastochloris viridis TaxID=1079 RepID=A0A0H5BBP5_BLAVI|nr:FAD-dependent oxidoreductase [Blastochloris viridis]ALK10383.1 Rhodocoxin reductase [Blastochloris viridis]BAR99677.1 ferredoxin reductase [Blastochloris viridis]CUU43045.1 Rhodocoxin reductase [Blastochloris viridis]
MSAGVVIIGGGQAGLQVATSLRQGGYGEAIRIIGAEPYAPYQRPPLSKAVLSGEAGVDTVPLRGQVFFTDNRLDLVTGRRVEAIDPGSKTVTAGADTIAYDHLIIATGADVRKIPVPGADLPGVLYLRGLDDALKLKEALTTPRNVVVIGGGFIGLEVAASATKLGSSAVVVEALPRVLARSTAPAMADAIVRRHTEKGVKIMTGAGVARIEGEGKVSAVVLSDGTTLAADLVVVGIGVVPAAGIAKAAGIDTDHGIVVDPLLRTSAPDVFAIGDVARFPTRFAPRPVMVESVQNAIDQGKAVAATILGKGAAYDAVPWFWSDQFDMKLQTTGLAFDIDETVVRGDADSLAFSVFQLKGGRVIAVDSLNKPADHMIGRRLVAAGAQLRTEDLADPSYDLKRAAMADAPRR